MFPYGYYGSPNLLYTYAVLPYALDSRQDQYKTLPEDVKESLELHTGEFKSSDDIHRFLHEQELRK